MLDVETVSFAATSERDLRRQIDRAISRALVDREFAQLLLLDPTVAVRERGCAPQHYRKLLQIHALDVTDFAQQAQALFWTFEPTPSCLEEQISVPAAAAR